MSHSNCFRIPLNAKTSTSSGSGSGIGEIENIGSEVELVANGTGPIASVRTLKAGLGMNLQTIDDSVHIINTAPNTYDTLSSAGSGVSLIKDGSGSTKQLYSLTAGANITISEADDEITIEGIGGGDSNIMPYISPSPAPKTKMIVWSFSETYPTGASSQTFNTGTLVPIGAQVTGTVSIDQLSAYAITAVYQYMGSNDHRVRIRRLTYTGSDITPNPTVADQTYYCTVFIIFD